MKRYSLQEVEQILIQHEYKQIQLFKDLLPTIVSPVPTMVELGAAEGFYSILFSKYFTSKKMAYKNICLELAKHKIDYIKESLPDAVTFHGYIGNLDKNDGDVIAVAPQGTPVKFTIQQVFELANLTNVDYLHVDIQGGENALVDELMDSPLLEKIRYFFFSTHDEIIPNTHDKCYKLLSRFSIIVNSTNGWEKWGYADGLIVAENVNYKHNK